MGQDGTETLSLCVRGLGAGEPNFVLTPKRGSVGFLLKEPVMELGTRVGPPCGIPGAVSGTWEPNLMLLSNHGDPVTA